MITRRTLLRTLPGVLAAPLGAASGRPNVLLIISDQLHHGAYGSAGNPVVKTPNLDRLAQQGETANLVDDRAAAAIKRKLHSDLLRWMREAEDSRASRMLSDQFHHGAYGGAGNPVIKTPNLDRLAQQGETANLVDDRAAAAIRRKLHSDLLRWMREAEDSRASRML